MTHATDPNLSRLDLAPATRHGPLTPAETVAPAAWSSDPA